MKKAYFYIDDTIWVLRDITRQKPASLFDNPFMNVLKTAHEKYGLKVQLNLFYRTDSFYGYDEFTLAEVTDAYKSEFEASSEWLRFAFHAKEEFPDYPHINATYEDTKSLFKDIEREVFRFAGEKSFSYTVCPHWLPVSKAAVKALKDCGVTLLDATSGDTKEYDGDPYTLPYGHAARLLHNRQPETKLFTRNSPDKSIISSICGFNHMSEEDRENTHHKLKAIYNEETGMLFKIYGTACLNLTEYDKIEELFLAQIDNEYIGICDHEQYFYSDYFAYQSDYADKIYKMGEVLSAHGFVFVTGDELLER